ncbi:MAG: hypothetical protein MUD03_18000, partial [Pirellula sp.]|nr:hypothetical protein [Pirellula sp.]
ARITSSDFSAACRSASRSTSGFNAAGWINNRGIAARARRAAAFTSEQTVQKVATEALSAKGSSNNH